MTPPSVIEAGAMIDPSSRLKCRGLLIALPFCRLRMVPLGILMVPEPLSPPPPAITNPLSVIAFSTICDVVSRTLKPLVGIAAYSVLMSNGRTPSGPYVTRLLVFAFAAAAALVLPYAHGMIGTLPPITDTLLRKIRAALDADAMPRFVPRKKATPLRSRAMPGSVTD